MGLNDTDFVSPLTTLERQTKSPVPCPDLSTHLLKLMDSKDATGVTPMGAHLLAKAGGQAGILDWQVLWPKPLVPVKSSNGLFRGSNQIFINTQNIYL